jgi:hypothetical protein
MLIRVVPPVRTPDGDLLLLCPSRTTLRKNALTPVNTEARVAVPAGWRGLLTPPLQLVMSRVSFAPFLLSPSSRDVLVLDLLNAGGGDIGLEAGAPLAVLTLLPFHANTAEVQRVAVL